jgi:hypothetical protein
VAKRIAKHLLRSPKAIADEVLRRTVGAVITRINEFTDVFAAADGGTTGFLRADMTWSDPHNRTVTRVIGAPAFQPATPANWTAPNGATDYWTCNAVTSRIAAALPVNAGERIVGVGLNYYRGGATDPSPRILRALAVASASVMTPTVAWTALSGATVWETLYASYDEDTLITPTAATSWVIDVTATTTDRVRSALVTVELL